MGEPLLERQSVEAGGVAFDAVVLGDGTPTVVFANGLGSPLDEWLLVAPEIAERCRVVCYDRRPAPLTGALPTHDAALMAADLHHLLGGLNVVGPLVLVGHSWGGALIRRYAVDHPDDVAGLVFVDASHERIKGMVPNRATRAMYASTTHVLRIGPVRRRLLRMLGFDQLPPAVLTSIHNLSWRAQGRTARAEYAGIAPSCRELARVAPELPPVPTRILLAAGRPGLTTKLAGKQFARIRTVWEQVVAGREEIALQVVPDSGHYISLDKPQAVIDAIEDVVSQAQRDRIVTRGS